MFALIQSEGNTQNGYKIAKGLYLQELTITGVQVMCLNIVQERYGKRLERRMRCAERILREQKITHLIYQDTFLYKKNFLDLGFKVPDRDILYTALFPKLCTRVCAEPTEQAYIYAANFTNQVEDVFSLLCNKSRYVLTDMAWPESILRALQLKYGISVITNPGVVRTYNTGIAILFSAPSKRISFSDRCTVVGAAKCLKNVQGGRYVSGADLHIDLHGLPAKGFSEQEILSELIRLGQMDPRSLKVKRVRYAEEKGQMLDNR